MVLLPKYTKLYRSRSKSGESSRSVAFLNTKRYNYFSEMNERLTSRTGYNNRIHSRSGDNNMAWHWGPPPLRPEDFTQIHFNKDLTSILEEHI